MPKKYENDGVVYVKLHGLVSCILVLCFNCHWFDVVNSLKMFKITPSNAYLKNLIFKRRLRSTETVSTSILDDVDDGYKRQKENDDGGTRYGDSYNLGMFVE